MNKTVSVALAGFSFVIEEHAYIKLSDYLEALRSSLEQAEADEVMYDIEIRIAEIFKGNLEKREVVSVEDVEKVIAQIGTPEAIGEQEEAYYSEEMKSNKFKENIAQKQLYRDMLNRKIAGVCSGLAHYVGLDISIMRWIWLGIFVLGIFSAGISSTLVGILYVIFWAVMPKAETTADILKMKGKPVDFENIKDESLKFANESGQKLSEFYETNKPVAVRISMNIWDIFRKILGIIFAGMAISTAIVGVTGVYAVFYELNSWGLDFYFDVEHHYIIMASVLLGSVIFTLIFTAFSVKLFSPKTKVRNFFYTAGGMLLILIGISIYLGIHMMMQEQFFAGSKHEEDNIALTISGQTLEVGVKEVAIAQSFKAYGREFFSDRNKVFKKDRPDVDIVRRANISEPYLVVRKEANGYNVPMKVNIPLEVKEGRILFPNYIIYPYEHRFRDYDIDYELVVPMDVQVIDMSKGTLRLDEENNDFDDDWEDNFKKAKEIKINSPAGTIHIQRQ